MATILHDDPAVVPSADALALDFQLGALHFTALSDGCFVAPSKLLAPEVAPDEVIALYDSRGARHEPTFANPINCLLVRDFGDYGNVLVDSGFGTLPGPAGKPIPTAGQLPKAMAEAGVAPGDVHTVLVSHIHPDHIGGLFRDDDTPLLPDATYYVSQEEVDFWGGSDPDLGGTLMPPPMRAETVHSAQNFIRRAGDRLRTFAAGTLAIDGVETILLAGHTPGQVGFLFQSAGDALLYTADAAGHHHISLQRPDWRFSFDTNSPLAITTRKALIELLLEKGWYNFTPHFPWPGFGRLARAGDHVIWRQGL